MSITVDSFLNHLTYERRLSPHTVTAYAGDLGQMCEYLLRTYEEAEPAKAEFAMLRSWIVEMMGEGMSPRSVNRKVASARSFFKFLRKTSELKTDPTLRLRTPKIQRPLPEFIAETELQVLLDNSPTPTTFPEMRDRLIIELLYGTGIRLAELISLREDKVDLRAESIRVVGKGNKERSIPINTSLRRRIEVYGNMKKSTFPPNQTASLIVNDKGRAVYPMFVYRIVKRYLSLILTAEKKSPHILRHSFATHLLNKGADLNAIKDLLGHSSLAATQVYTHNSIEKMRAVFEQAHPKA